MINTRLGPGQRDLGHFKRSDCCTKKPCLQSRLKSSTAVLQCDHHTYMYVHIVGIITIQGKEKQPGREGKVDRGELRGNTAH